LRREITQLVETVAPTLLAEPGVGPISAARILIAWSHRRRFRSEAAFAMLAGTGIRRLPRSIGAALRGQAMRNLNTGFSTGSVFLSTRC
jgi:transposase